MSTDLVSDEDDEAAASFSAALIALVGSVAIWAAIASSGSIEKPRMAVTAPVEEDVAVVNAEGVLIPDTGAEKLERRRNMAEGFSLDNLISLVHQADERQTSLIRALTFRGSVSLFQARKSGPCSRIHQGRELYSADMISVTESLGRIRHTCSQ